MEFRDVVVRRRMVRNYTDASVDHAAIDRILDAAVRAPSAGFSQGQRFVVVTEPDRRHAIAVAAGEPHYVADGFDPWISRAPVHIVLAVDKGAYLRRYSEPDKTGDRGRPSVESDWIVPFWWVDAGASMMALLYAAVDEGLAAGFLGVQAFDGIRDVTGIPDDVDIVGVCTLGYPAEDRRSGSLARGWNDRASVVRWEHWG
ncbi:MAG: nitroreductase family protein [Acidimicrobiia bacterium]|nr:nitroreductase family protein [Acidimicrobiia bacterium]